MLRQLGRSQAKTTLGPASIPLPRRIVALGGGTGLPTVLRSLRLTFGETVPRDAITAIVTVSDDGGSSGRLREELRMLPPGDVRNCLAALADEHSPLAQLLQHRLTGGNGLDGHTVGNLMLAGLTQQMDGDFVSAVEALGRIIGTGGRVLPATADSVHLRAEYLGGEVIRGETAIAARQLPIRRLSLEHPVLPLPDAIEALVNADMIIVGPGSLYTSLLPVLLVDGIAPTIYGVRATRIYVANLMTEPGETDRFSLEEHLEAIEQHVGVPLFDYVLVNGGEMPQEALARYARGAAEPVRRRSVNARLGSAEIIERNLAWEIEGGKIRHCPRNLAAAISTIMIGSEADEPSHAVVRKPQ